MSHTSRQSRSKPRIGQSLEALRNLSRTAILAAVEESRVVLAAGCRDQRRSLRRCLHPRAQPQMART